MGAKTAAELNPRTQHYEFLGPLGALFITLGVPATTYALYYGCSETSGGCPPQLDTLYPSFLAAVQDKEWWLGLWDTKAALAYLAWYSFCVVAWFILPGDWIEGVTMRTGEKKKYKINGTYFYCIPALDVSKLYIPAFTTFLLQWVPLLVSSTVSVLRLSLSSTNDGSVSSQLPSPCLSSKALCVISSPSAVVHFSRWVGTAETPFTMYVYFLHRPSQYSSYATMGI